MRSPLSLLIAVVAFFLLSGTGSAVDAHPKDDAYHYMKNGIDDRLYNEWWYYGGIASDAQFHIAYFISDPENLTGQRRLQALSVILEDGKPTVVGSRQSRGFGGDRNSPAFDLDQSGFSPLDETGLKVWGEVNDRLTAEPVRWDLIYRPSVGPWFAIPVQRPIGHSQGNWIKWLSYMPSANVTGSLSIGNRTWNVSAVGYHDHLWGRWILNDPQFVFAQASVPEDGFSVTLGGILGDSQSTLLGIKYRGETIVFSGKQIKLSNTAIAFDPETARTYPAAFEVAAENGNFRLNMLVRAERTVPLQIDYSPPMPGYLVFAQLSDLQGILRSRSGDEYQFDARGSSGSTSHRLHPIYGKVNATGGGVRANVTVAARNLRTGQEKKALTTPEGWFSIDADYAVYLANSTAPWVADGDPVRLETSGLVGGKNSTTLNIDLGVDRQEANL